MKSTLYTAVAALLVFSSCTTAYQTARTPDDVYYSPRTERTYASNNNRDNNYQQDGQVVNGGDEGNYVTYDDGEKGDYARRIERFRNPYSGNYYEDGFSGSPNIYMNNYYGIGNSWGNSFGLGFGGGWGSPWYNSWGPSISLGMNWGWGGGFNRPWNPWYGGGWYGGGWGYNPWYPHYSAWGGYPGWGGGWHGGPVYFVNPPARRTRTSYAGGDYPAPRRSFGDVNGAVGGGNNNGYRPRRVFSEEMGTSNPGGRGNSGSYNPGNNGYQPRRVFNTAPSERPVIGNQPTNNGGYQPRRVFQESSRPQPQYQQPQRSFQNSSPSYTPSSSPSGGGGGGSRGAGRTRG